LLTVGLACVACDNGSTSDTTTDEPAVYKSEKDGTSYRLEITGNTDKAALTPKTGDSYTLTITIAGGATNTSTGKITAIGAIFTLTHTSGAAFTVTINNGSMTGINGNNIPTDDGTPMPAPGTVTPQSPGGRTAPSLTSVSTGTYDEASKVFTPKTSFTVNEPVWVKWQGNDPDKDVKKEIYTLKKGAHKERSYEVDLPSNASYPLTFWIPFSDFSASAGNYTVEVQLIDSKGNQSNILSANFTVQ
jgi:hypothetical protein